MIMHVMVRHDRERHAMVSYVSMRHVRANHEQLIYIRARCDMARHVRAMHLMVRNAMIRYVRVMHVMVWFLRVMHVREIHVRADISWQGIIGQGSIKPRHVRVTQVRAINGVVRNVISMHVRAMHCCCNRANIPYQHH
jgi:hypothetical protein